MELLMGERADASPEVMGFGVGPGDEQRHRRTGKVLGPGRQRLFGETRNQNFKAILAVSFSGNYLVLLHAQIIAI